MKPSKSTNAGKNVIAEGGCTFGIVSVGINYCINTKSFAIIKNKSTEICRSSQEMMFWYELLFA